MPEPPVVNASPVIILSRAGKLDLFRMLGDRIIVPAVVAAEVKAHSVEAARVLAEAWIEEAPRVPIAEVVAPWDLGPGESSVLTWALAHSGTLAVIDDFAARKCASALGVQVKGTLGLALLAKQSGHVSKARPLVEELRRAGLYLSEAVVRDALALVGE